MANTLLASKTILTEAPPRIRSITALPTAVVLMVGLAVRGPIGVPRLFTDFETWRNTYGPANTDTLDTFAAVQAFFEEGGQFLWFVRTAHYTDITDASTLTALIGEITADTQAATPAELTAVNSATYNLQPNDDISIDVDGGGAATATVTATRAELTSGNTAAFALTDLNTLQVQVDNGDIQEVVFNTADFVAIGAATADEVVAVLNAALSGCSVVESAGAIVIRSDVFGSSSEVDVVGGTDAAAFAFPAAATGSGNVANVAAVTYAEIETILEAAIAGIDIVETAPGSGIPVVQTTSTGATSSLEVTASTGIQAALGLPAGPVNGTPGVPVNAITFEGKTPGAYANSVIARVLDATNGETDRYDLHVVENGFVVETYQNLTSADEDDELYVETVLDQQGVGSLLITATVIDTGRPANGDYTLAGGDDGLTDLADSDFIGSDASDTGIRAFDVVTGGTILLIPERPTPAVHNAMIQYAEVTRDLSMIAILDLPEALNTQAVIEYVETTAGLINNSEHAVAYWPRVKILNPNKAVFGPEDNITVANSGHIAGAWARQDASKPGGIYENAAGIGGGPQQGGRLRTITGLEDDPDGGEVHQVNKEANRDLVYPKLINPIDDDFGFLAIDGTRTLKSDGNFPGVAERRGVIFIEQSTKTGIQFARHRNHTAELRNEVERTITKFLTEQMSVGAFRSTNPEEAFFVDVGTGLNTPDVVFANQIRVRVGLATNKSIDWVILEFTQDTRALEQALAQA